MFLYLFASCNPADELEIPTHIQNLDNLIVLASEEGQGNTIHLVREMEFGSSDDLMIGELGSFC